MTSIRWLVLSLAFLSVADSSAASAWRFGNGPGGEVNVALFASNVVTTGSRAIDYRPTLTVSCKADRDPQWRQSISVREPFTGRGPVDVKVRIDTAGDRRETWSLGQKNRALVHDGGAAVARLTGARLLRVAWRAGFFAGDDEAVFNLAGAGDAIAALAASCGVPMPRP